MEEPIRVEEPRLSRTTLFWLVLLVAGNLAVIALIGFSGAQPPPTRAAIAEPEQGSSLVLLNELTEGERDQLVRLPSPADVPARVMDPLVCRVWGPFTEAPQFASLQARISELGTASEIRSSELAGEPDYLVFIETGNNVDTARRTLQELETQSIDSYIIAGGPYLNSVSVGVFSRGDRAINQQLRVAALGYDVKVQELVRSQTVFHLVARVPESLDLGEDPGVDCEAIASIQ
jgi:hypothetical protein